MFSFTTHSTTEILNCISRRQPGNLQKTGNSLKGGNTGIFIIVIVSISVISKSLNSYEAIHILSICQSVTACNNYKSGNFLLTDGIYLSL
jgi:hypothetical protein